MSINMRLAEARGLDEDTIAAIETVHDRLKLILNRPTYYGEPKEIVKIVEGIEYTLQLLWGFPLDGDSHWIVIFINGGTVLKTVNVLLWTMMI